MSAGRRVLTSLLESGVAAYALVVGALYLFQRSLLYHPDRSRPDPGALTELGGQRVNLKTADGLSLESWYLPPPDERPVIAYFHGNGGHMGHRAERLRRFAGDGYGVLMAEYRGYGGNPGSPSEQGLYADARTALDFLEAAGIAAARVALYGESLGTGVAVQLACERSVAAIILESPFTSIAAAAQIHYPWVPAARLVRDRFDSLAKIGRVRAPILILQGERDRVVPVRLGRALYAAAPEPKEIWVAPEGGHEDLARHGALDAALAFLRRRLG